jgi:hypothetical protein
MTELVVTDTEARELFIYKYLECNFPRIWPYLNMGFIIWKNLWACNNDNINSLNKVYNLRSDRDFERFICQCHEHSHNTETRVGSFLKKWKRFLRNPRMF